MDIVSQKASKIAVPASISMADFLAMKARAEAAEAAAAAAKASTVRGLRAKASEKGALSLYGLGQWPTTLYKSQWLRVAEWIRNGGLEAAFEDPTIGPRLKEGKA